MFQVGFFFFLLLAGFEFSLEQCYILFLTEAAFLNTWLMYEHIVILLHRNPFPVVNADETS